MLQLTEWAWKNSGMRKCSSNSLLAWGIGGGSPPGSTPSDKEHCNLAKHPGCASPWPHYEISESKNNPNELLLRSYKANEFNFTIGPTIRVFIHFWMLSLQKLCYLLKQANPLKQRCWLGQNSQLKVILIMFTPWGVYFSCFIISHFTQGVLFSIKRG